MRLWPFRRKSNRKRKQSAAQPLPDTVMHAQQDPGKAEASPLATSRKKSGAGNDHRRSGREPKKLQRDPERRTYSFSPGRHDAIQVPKDIHHTHPVPPLPQDIASASAGQKSGQDWQRVPTLHKRSGQDLPRRKSSKKRKEEHDREAEIKAMSVTMPLPPTRAATDVGFAGTLVHKQSRKARRELSRNFTSPTLEPSVPTVDSLHSSPSSDEESYVSYKLKTLEALAPRPTIRYAQNPRFSNSLGAGSQEFGSRRLPDREELTQSILKANNRIDDLADDLDASALRQLMERDQRRKERTKLADQKKAERKIARNAERQRQAEAEAVRNGTPPPRNMDRGVLGREAMGLGVEGETSSASNASDASSKRRGKRPAALEQAEPTTVEQQPLGEFKRADSLPLTEPNSPLDDGEDLEIGTAKVARLSRASMSPPSSPKGHVRDASNISEMMDLAKPSTPAVIPTDAPMERPLEKPEANRSSSESGARQHRSWTAFFGRSNKSKRNSTPTSFSNTSRESAAMLHPPPPTSFTPRGSISTVPKRTKSRFREDLPESPISPPDSRLQSPEADVVPPIRTGFPEKKPGVRGSIENPLVDASVRRHDTPTSGYRSLEQAPRNRNETPTSDHRSEIPSPEPSAVMSQSLASIDSEGSWLSGRPRGNSKRGSAQQAVPPLRDSASSLRKRFKEFSDSAEELGIAEDEYFSRLTPGPDDDFGARSKRRASGNPMPSSDEEDGESVASPGGSTKWGAVGRHPTVVHHGTHAKSREGLLNDFRNASPGERPGDTPRGLADRKRYSFDKPLPDDPAISRASSVNLGRGHARHISAGSARLLDLKARPSGESKRLSLGQQSESAR